MNGRSIAMIRQATGFVGSLTIVAALLISPALSSQRERQLVAPRDENDQYGERFFDQLKAVFGRFRDSDLQRAFENAHSIQCSELINQKGEWRPVAFFNDNRELASWYRQSFEQVRHDVSAYLFKGTCRGQHAALQLTTKYPVVESLEAYQHGSISIDDVEINVNPQVRTSFDSGSHAYVFDLPYLFFVRYQGFAKIYSLEPSQHTDKYATEVLDHWECKSVKDQAVTYQFLICRATILSRDKRLRGLGSGFGASAYWILSDGREAGSTVKLTYNDANNVTHIVEDSRAAVGSEGRDAAEWEPPDSTEKILDIINDELRVQFSEAWKDKIGAAQFISGQHLTNLSSSYAVPGVDYCSWLPKATAVSDLLTNARDSSFRYSLTPGEQNPRSSAIQLKVNTRDGRELASLTCVFANESNLSNIMFGRWESILGEVLKVEVRH